VYYGPFNTQRSRLTSISRYYLLLSDLRRQQITLMVVGMNSAATDAINLQYYLIYLQFPG
jgi:hypothetical protein